MLRLSFILPCYNVSRYIGACIDSIEVQDIPQDEYEVICVDDCSQDNTVEIIQQYQQKYSNIRLYCHTTNKTAGGARNTGIDNARGEYIWFVDPDDMIANNTLSKLLKRAEDNDLDIALFNFYTTKEFLGNIEVGDNTYFDTDVMDGYSFLDLYNKNIGRHSIVWLQLYRRKLLEKHVLRYPKLRVSQDAVFAWRAFFCAARVQAEKECRYVYRANSQSTTGTPRNAIKIYSEQVNFPLSLLALSRDNDIREDYRKQIINAGKYDYNRLFPMYMKLSKEERVKLVHLLYDNRKDTICINGYLSFKKRIALMFLFSYHIFDWYVNHFLRN